MTEQNGSIGPADDSFPPPLAPDGSGFGHPLSGLDPNWTPPITEPQIQEPVVPQDLAALFGEPPILSGETRQAFDEHWARIRQAMRPRDGIQELFAYNAAVTSWQVIGYRRLRARLLDQPFADLLRQALRKAKAAEEASVLTAAKTTDSLVQAVLQGDPAARQQATALLASVGDSLDAIAGRAFLDRGLDLARIDAMVAGYEEQWHRTLKEAGRYKEHLAALVPPPRRYDDDDRLGRRDHGVLPAPAYR